MPAWFKEPQMLKVVLQTKRRQEGTGRELMSELAGAQEIWLHVGSVAGR